jgi:hypothetical protein
MLSFVQDLADYVNKIGYRKGWPAAGRNQRLFKVNQKLGASFPASGQQS